MKNGKITNNQRIVASLPTIKYALEKQAKSVVLQVYMEPALSCFQGPRKN